MARPFFGYTGSLEQNKSPTTPCHSNAAPCRTNPPHTEHLENMQTSTIHFRTFLLLLAAVSIAFVIVLLPFYAAIFWGVAFAVIFTPLYRRLYGSFGRRRNLAAFAVRKSTRLNSSH